MSSVSVAGINSVLQSLTSRGCSTGVYGGTGDELWGEGVEAKGVKGAKGGDEQGHDMVSSTLALLAFCT